MTIELVPQIAAIVLAGAGAVTDALHGKIYNRMVVAGLVFAAAWLALYGAWHAMDLPTALGRYPELGPTFWDHALKTLLNAAIALAAGFAMWWFGMWAAADAKLFGVLAALLPLSTYSGAYWPVFPAYVLAFNSFLGVLAVLGVELLFRVVRQAIRPTEDESQAWRDAAEWVRSHNSDLALGFLGILFLFLCLKTLRGLASEAIGEVAEGASGTAVYLVLFVVFHPLAAAMRRKWVAIAVGIATAGWIGYVSFFPTESHDIMTVLQVGTLSGALVAVRLIYGLFLAVFDVRTVRIWELAPGMLPARQTMEVLKEDADLLATKMGPVGPDGLDPEQTETLRRWWIDRGKGGEIRVCRTIPFAWALFFGTVVTVAWGGYLLWM